MEQHKMPKTRCRKHEERSACEQGIPQSITGFQRQKTDIVPLLWLR